LLRFFRGSVVNRCSSALNVSSAALVREVLDELHHTSRLPSRRSWWAISPNVVAIRLSQAGFRHLAVHAFSSLCWKERGRRGRDLAGKQALEKCILSVQKRCGFDIHHAKELLSSFSSTIVSTHGTVIDGTGVGLPSHSGLQRHGGRHLAGGGGRQRRNSYFSRPD